MRFLKILLAAPLIALMLSASPAYAGKNKTDDAWVSAVSQVRGSVSDKAALAEVEKMNSVMSDGYNLDKSEFYALASKMFPKLNALSEKHGGAKVSKPGWLD